MKNPLVAKLRPLADSFAQQRSGRVEDGIDAGGSAAVFRAVINGRSTALKVYDPSFFDEHNAPAERRRVELQRQLIGHECAPLVGFHDIAEEAGTCFIAMEFVPWKTLKDVCGQVPTTAIVALMAQLVDAVRFLASKGIVHRDIKPENILVSPDFAYVKLIDLGVAREMSGDEEAMDATDHSGRRPFIATAQYSSPEYLFRLEAPSQSMWQALTIYQLGGVLHDLVMKRQLFDAEVKTGNKFNVAAAVLRRVPDFTGVPNPLLRLATLASHCLSKDWQLRLRLASLDDLAAEPSSAAEKLRVRLAKAEMEKRASADLEQQKQQNDIQRKKALESIGEGIRTRMTELSAKKMAATEYADRATRLVLKVPLDAVNTVTVHANVLWDEQANPLLGSSSVKAVLNGDPEHAAYTERPIGEIDAIGAGLTTVCDAHFDVICEAVLAAQNIVGLGGSAVVERDLFGQEHHQAS